MITKHMLLYAFNAGMIFALVLEAIFGRAGIMWAIAVLVLAFIIVADRADRSGNG